MSKIEKTLSTLKAYCETHDHRLTDPRLFAFEIVVSAKKPVTAYEVLERLGEKLSAPKPPTAYRALDFLSAHGFIHRIESLNAYVACHENHQHHGSQFMICDSCGNVEEAHLCSVPAGLQKQAEEKRFTVTHWNVELHGVCKKCA
jgi:Fur family zinc uptake transcriptional regulator